MPQLDFSVWPPQLIWLTITFVALYIIMARVALPRIAEVIEHRRDRIANDLDRAQELKDKSEKARQDYETALGEARSQAHDIAQDTRDRMASLTERQRAMSEAALANKIEQAEASIAQTKARVLARLDEISVETASELVETLIGKGAKPAQIKKAVKAAIAAQEEGSANG